jgi:predicted dehydrogenase
MPKIERSNLKSRYGKNKVLVIGTGSIGRRHIYNIRLLLKGCVEFLLVRGQARIDEFSENIGARVFSDIQKALQYEPDFAIVASPSAYHFGNIRELLLAQIPIYIEKPVVTSSEQVEQLRTLKSQVPNVVTLTGCNLRFLPSLQIIRELVQQGTLGPIVRASFTAGQWLPDWRPNQDYTSGYSISQEKGGGVILDLIHEIDAARWLLGEFDQIACMAGSLSSLCLEVEDTACILMRNSQGGAIVNVAIDYVSRRPVRRYELVGDQGTLTWDLHNKQLLLTNAQGEHNLLESDHAFDIGRTYISAMQEFMLCIKKNLQTSQNIWDGLKTTELALKLKQKVIL